jgi:hypothetical protein
LEQLPDDPDIQTMFAEPEELRSKSDTNDSTASESSGALWDSLSEEQQSLLNDLEVAAEAFDYRSAFEIMTSSMFLALCEQSNAYENFKREGASEYTLHFWEDDDIKDYEWDRLEDEESEVNCQLWIEADRAVIIIKHMAMTDGVYDGAYEMLKYESQDATAYRYEGLAVNNLKQGRTVKTDLITGDSWVHQFEGGKCVNYITDEAGSTYVQSENGVKWSINPDDVMQADTFY